VPVLFTLRDSYGDTVSMVYQRTAGTVLGAIGAAVALTVAPGKPTLITLIVTGAAIGFTLKPSIPAYWYVFGTPMIMLLIDFTAPLSWVDALWRIGLTAGGGVLSVLAARLLWPTGTRRQVPGLVTRLLGTHAEVARTVAAQLDGDRETSIRSRIADAANAGADVEDAAVRLAREPAPPLDAIHGLTDTVALAARVRDHLRALDVFTGGGPRAVGPIPAVLERIADHLDAGTALDAGDLLAELDDHLVWLTERRHAELDAGAVDAGDLRRSLVDVAGARYAVHALCSDADHLRELVAAQLG
jgi:uncharacterized membrane protein YccC